MKVLFILGTRPDAIKLAPVIKSAQKKRNIKTLICITSQHRHMLYPVLKFFDVNPDYNFNLMRYNQSLYEFTSRAFKKLGLLIKDIKPDWIIVQGDTTTSFVGAMAGFYNRVKIAHVEAGLRTYNKFAPFPEEMNRILITRLADLHFAPTLLARDNLLKEGVPPGRIVVTGNTGIDALLWAKKRLASLKKGRCFEEIFNGINFSKKIVLITGHRRESFGRPFRQICLALRDIARYFSEAEFIYPVHLNPNVRKPVFNMLKGIKNIHLIEPLDYPSFIWLMNKSYLIITDSGGIQEEAPSLGKPVLVLREETERKEGVQAGVAELVGTDRNSIFKATSKLLTNHNYYSNMSKIINLYGDGKASKKILESLFHYYKIIKDNAKIRT